MWRDGLRKVNACKAGAAKRLANVTSANVRVRIAGVLIEKRAEKSRELIERWLIIESMC